MSSNKYVFVRPFRGAEENTAVKGHLKFSTSAIRDLGLAFRKYEASVVDLHAPIIQLHRKPVPDSATTRWYAVTRTDNHSNVNWVTQVQHRLIGQGE